MGLSQRRGKWLECGNLDREHAERLLSCGDFRGLVFRDHPAQFAAASVNLLCWHATIGKIVIVREIHQTLTMVLADTDATKHPRVGTSGVE